MRLQKFISRAGFASRRKAEAMIRDGLVAVNGRTTTEMGVKIDPERDVVTIGGEQLALEDARIYILLNKPKGVVSTLSDNFDRPIVTDLVPLKKRVYPVGRLDYDSRGLLLLTNDGDLANRLTHPRHHVSKTYLVTASGVLSPSEIRHFEQGVDIGGCITAPCKIQASGKNRYRIVLKEGKNRQIRRMFEALGHQVVDLQRISIGNIRLGDLEEGSWRHLTPDEIAYLKRI